MVMEVATLLSRTQYFITYVLTLINRINAVTKSISARNTQIIISNLLIVCFVATWPSLGFAGRVLPTVPAAVADRLSKGTAQDLIILYDDRDVETEAATLRQRARKSYDDDSIMAIRRAWYRSIKQATAAGFALREVEQLRDYDHLPMNIVRIKSRSALDRLLADPRVQAIYEDLPMYPHLTYSLPFIGQPAAAGAGFTGSGQTVAVIDTGINYTLAAFGSCTAPGVPAGCRVAAAVDVNGINNLVTTANNHGTNVSGIVVGVAPGAKIASFNALPGGSGSTSDVIAGINWAIAKKSTYNIVALNMSLGDGSKNTSACNKSSTNPFLTPLNNARTAGIIPVASSGNDGYTNAMASPACTPGVVSVGAVYDANWGGPYSWVSGCTDSAASAPDRIPCFSNSASFLTILAPGAFITAAGIQMAGTSQAAPHVAGAIAMMRAAYPADSLDQSVGRLTSGGVSITDSRNSIIKPRLNLLAAITPANDMFADRPLLAGDTGQVTAHNLNATKETGEPGHAGNPGGKSVWWRWIPSASGVASFDTHGSLFDTLLAVYSGSTLAGLSQVAANDNDGSPGNTSGVAFTAQAGNEYLIAVDGFNGASGEILLNWSLAQQADLGITISQNPASPFAGDNVTYMVTVTNHGPSAANGISVTDQLPTGVGFVSASTGCSLSAGTVTCTIGTLANNTSASIQIVVTTLAAGDLTNSVQVSSTTSDPQTANNSTTATMTVSQAVAVPALSPWGMLVAAVCLAGIAGVSNKRSAAL
jgi:uncharacterized repeat protein (TIGR01451 family)